MATVNGKIFKTNGAARVAKLFFRPLNTPYYIAAGVVTTEWPSVTSDEDGEFSIELSAGYYEVTVGQDKFEINVESDAGTYDIEDIATDLNLMPPASNTNQGTFDIDGDDFELPSNSLETPGSPVATGWTQTVYGPGKFQIEACIMIQATSRDVANGINENEKYTAYIKNVTGNTQLGQSRTVQDIYTGTKGQMILRATLEIATATNVLIEIYAAGNPNTDNDADSLNSVGTLIAAESTISISRLP